MKLRRRRRESKVGAIGKIDLSKRKQSISSWVGNLDEEKIDSDIHLL